VAWYVRAVVLLVLVIGLVLSVALTAALLRIEVPALLPG